MRKIAAICLLHLIVLSNTTFHELAKFGVFVAHFSEHKSLNSDISFLQFIQLHYFNGDIHDADYERDMQLPFKTLDFQAPGLLFTVPQSAEIMVGSAPVDCCRKIMPYDESLFRMMQPADIWEPPKFV